MNGRRGRNATRSSVVAWGFKVGTVSLLAGIAVAWPAQVAAEHFPAWIALPVLLGIILIGVISDMIGVAATAADEVPFHARSAKRRPGAKEGLWLVRNAHQVANVCSDVVGDLSGTLSGAVGVALVLRVWRAPGKETIGTAVAVGVISALAIGLKAWGKAYAIRRADALVFGVGRILHALGRVVGGPAGRQRGG